MFKTPLKNLSIECVNTLAQKFQLFTGVIDAEGEIYLYGVSCLEDLLDDRECTRVVGICVIKHSNIMDSFNHTQRSGWVLDIIEVLPEHRGQRVARAMLKEVMADIAKSDQHMFLSKLTHHGKKYLVQSLEMWARRYGVFVDYDYHDDYYLSSQESF